MNTKSRVVTYIYQIDFSKKFVCTAGNWLSYNLFFTRCYELAIFLQNYTDYNTVTVILENGLPLFELYFAVIMTQKEIIVVDPIKSNEEIAEILSSIPKSLLIKENTVKIEKNFQFYDISESFFSLEHTVMADMDIKLKVIHKIEDRDFTNTYLVTFTSGTTGTAKGIKHSLNNLFSSIYAMLQKTCLPKEQRFLHVMPMSYMAGILNSIFYPFIAGFEIIISKRFSIKEALRFWDYVVEQQITVFWLSPAMLLMIEQVDRKELGVEYCKNHEMYFHVGTAALTFKVKETFERRYGVQLYASYGLSETLFISIETPKSKYINQENNVGEMLENVQYSIDQSGELSVKVPWMFLGYTNDVTHKYFENSYYKTGDLAKVSQNLLYITGRKKDLIIRGGINISPVKIENIVMKEDIIKECTTFSVKNKYEEELTCCAYVLKQSNEMCEELESRLNLQITKTLGKSYYVDYFWQVSALSRNINGKIDKKEMERQFTERYGNKI